MSLSCLLYQGCDVTTVQQHYKGSTSTPPRVARLCQIREASFVALRKISPQKKSTLAHMCRSVDSSNPSYSYPEISIVTRRHCTICQVNSSQSALFPYQAPISICGNHSRPSAFVPTSLGFTSVLTDDIVRSFRNTKS